MHAIEGRVFLPVSFNERTWELSVDGQAVPSNSIGGDGLVGNMEIICASNSSVWHRRAVGVDGSAGGAERA